MAAKVMILVVSPYTNSRIRYVLDFIKSSYQNMEIKLLDSSTNKELPQHSALIEYNTTNNLPNALFIQSHSLLQEDSIRNLNTNWKNNQIEEFSNNSELGFDIFAAIFYQLSRYEEYLPSPLDQFGRFDSSNSTFVGDQKEMTPWVDKSVFDLMAKLQERFPNFKPQKKRSSALATMDVDIAYEFLGRKPFRAIGAALKDIAKPLRLINRLKVFLHLQKDPAYIFKELEGKNISYFIHVGDYGPLDKNAGLSKKEFQAFLQKLPSQNIGLHPSFQSHLDIDELLFEQEQLEVISTHNIFISRQHYIKLILPDTYEVLSQIGITKDFSMGWPDRPGYRSGTTHPHHFFNLKANIETSLKLVPFAWMDAHFLFGDTKLEIKDTFLKIKQQHENFGGHFTPIFHNNHFSKNPILFKLINLL